MQIKNIVLSEQFHLDESNPNRKKIAIFSHERSGTHFLMNTIAENFGYIVEPWWDFDHNVTINIYYSGYILEYLNDFKNKPILNILKSHHASDFFIDILPEILEDFKIIYIFRDPRDVMLSFWHYTNKLDPFLGPQVKNLSDFIHSAPCGSMLRYQTKQFDTIIDRWSAHVNGWIEASEKLNSENLLLLNYEILNLKFDFTLEHISNFLDMENKNNVRPDKEKNTVLPGPGIVGNYSNYLTEKDLEYIYNKAGDLMLKLGYIK